jgi:hypothetical protein
VQIEETMMNTRWYAVASVVLVLATIMSESPGLAAVRSREKTLAETREDKVLVYFIRPMKYASSSRTAFIYAGETFLGVVDVNSYTFAYLDPGRHLLWLNWARITKEIEAEAGTVRYFWVYDQFSELNADEGRKRVREAGFYTTPDDRERQTALKHIAERRDKALEYAGVDTSRTSGPKDRDLKAERRIAEWPHVDLAPYSRLYIEDFRITDPEASERKNQDYVQTAPGRLADFVADDIGVDLFEEVQRGSPNETRPQAVVLRVEVTRYKPALFGKGAAAYLDYMARLVDGGSGEELGHVTARRNSGYGIDQLESSVARELSIYLEKCKGKPASPE